MRKIDEVGIEREFWLLKDGKIVEPKEYGFPYDEFGFLVELRSIPSTDPNVLLQDIFARSAVLHKKAEDLGLELHLIHRKQLPTTFVARLAKKYKYDKLPNLTANVYAGVLTDHASGIDYWTDQNLWGTAGVHVHFSRKKIPRVGLSLRRVQLPIWKIVTTMDIIFRQVINLTGRIQGEFELKPYGFEYRSLPADITLGPVIESAFNLLRKC